MSDKMKDLQLAMHAGQTTCLFNGRKLAACPSNLSKHKIEARFTKPF
jgi:hypothetical protein